jgi:hypothetical protein
MEDRKGGQRFMVACIQLLKNYSLPALSLSISRKFELFCLHSRRLYKYKTMVTGCVRLARATD